MFEKIKEILISELQVEEDLITMDAALASDLGVNSLELAELILVVEDKLDIEINEDDLHKFITVGDVVKYLEDNAK
ncbi:MAG: acyl carrier protein [Clostridia bacterium]|nr:acyl carrier protein [Clostridia bacterium]